MITGVKWDSDDHAPVITIYRTAKGAIAGTGA
jgi:hypothetical protein